MTASNQPILVRATEHIAKMAEFVAKLVEKNLAYRTDDGILLLPHCWFPQYGKLRRRILEECSTAARVDVDEYDKDQRA